MATKKLHELGNVFEQVMRRIAATFQSLFRKQIPRSPAVYMLLTSFSVCRDVSEICYLTSVDALVMNPAFVKVKHGKQSV
jgi:hypothetical protein